MSDPKQTPMTPDPQRVARRRSIAIAVTLGVLVALFYAATIVRLGGAVANKPW